MRGPSLRSPSLFWRTLLLVLLLIVASLGAWIQSFRVFERAPRAQNIAQQVVSVVNVTRAALLYSDPFVRRDLLAELAANEGIRIYPLEPTDAVVPVTEGPLIQMAAQGIVQRLGPDTRVASEVNGIRGLWVSLALDDDRYWVFIDRDPAARESCASGRLISRVMRTAPITDSSSATAAQPIHCVPKVRAAGSRSMKTQ